VRDILSEIIIKNFRADFIHKGRRQLKGKLRLDITGNLVDTKTDAITYVRKEAQKLIQFGDPYPPILPKTDVLRKAKSEIQEKRLGITGKLLIYTCILILNNNNNIHTYIRARVRVCVVYNIYSICIVYKIHV